MKTSIQPDKLLKIYQHFPELDFQWLLIDKPADINKIKYPSPLLKEPETKSIESNILSEGSDMKDFLYKLYEDNQRLNAENGRLLSKIADLEAEIKRLGGEKDSQGPGDTLRPTGTE